jgi:hypothetical protein
VTLPGGSPDRPAEEPELIHPPDLLEPAQAPDLLEPVVGFRRWLLREGRVASPRTREPWTPEPLRARCPVAGHAAPAPDCTCGIYAALRPAPRWDVDPWGFVAGAVVLWGRLEVHRSGVRGEYAQAVLLAIPPLASPARRREIREAAASLGAEVVLARQLDAAARRFGGTLPHSLLPA